MASEILVKQGTPIVWAGATYSLATSELTKTLAITLINKSTTTAQQGQRADLQHLATAKFPARWLVTAAMQFNTVPTSGGTVDFYWSGSPSSVPTDANAGGATGSDSNYDGITAGLLTASLLQLQYIGSLVAVGAANTIAQYQTIGILTAAHRYGQPIVVNNTNAATHLTVDAEMHIALTPLIDEAQ